MYMRPQLKKCVAEGLGTFALVFAGTGAIVVNETSNGAITHAGIALTFGLVVLAMIYTVGDISGAHLNPAVTIGFWAARRLPGREVVPYVLSQAAGAFIGSGLLRVLFPQNILLGTTLPAGSELQSFILEFLLTFLLMLTILNVSSGAKEKGITAGIAVGAIIGLEAMFAGPIRSIHEPDPIPCSCNCFNAPGASLALHHRAAHRRNGRNSRLSLHP
jgi:aquaporin NIP